MSDLLDWIHYQFPPTVGNIQLTDRITALEKLAELGEALTETLKPPYSHMRFEHEDGDKSEGTKL